MPAASARYALYGTIFEKDASSRDPAVFPLSKKTLKGYVKKDPENMRDPASEELVWHAADWRCGLGEEFAIVASIFLLIQFDCYFRPSESLELNKQHVTPPRRGTQNRAWSIVFYPSGSDKPAKNRQFDCGVVVGAHGCAWAVKLFEVLYKRILVTCRSSEDLL